jgi:hypothetical protein
LVITHCAFIHICYTNINHNLSIHPVTPGQPGTLREEGIDLPHRDFQLQSVLVTQALSPAGNSSAQWVRSRAGVAFEGLLLRGWSQQQVNMEVPPRRGWGGGRRTGPSNNQLQINPLRHTVRRGETAALRPRTRDNLGGDARGPLPPAASSSVPGGGH